MIFVVGNDRHGFGLHRSVIVLLGLRGACGARERDGESGEFAMHDVHASTRTSRIMPASM